MKHLSQTTSFKGSWIFYLFCLFLTSCSTFKMDGKPSDFHTFNANNVPDAIPKVEPKSKYGNPPSYVVDNHRYTILQSAIGYKERGIASWYGTKFYKERTSSGEPYNMYSMSAAHKTLPLPTYARVTNLSTGKSIIVKINDRGPFISNRIIDLSFVAAKKLGVIQTGTAYVEVDAIDAHYPEHINSTASKNYYNTHPPQVYLQLGAFTTQASAETLVKRIKEITSRSTHVVIYKTDSKLLYKVQVGPLSGVQEVDLLTSTFKQNRIGDAFAVIR